MRRAIVWLRVCAIASIACALAGFASGREPDAPARIAVLSPALGVILRDINASGAAAARHAFDVALDSSLPVAGDQTGIDYETLLRVRPTHVLLEWGTRELPPRLRTLAQERGWLLESFPMLTLEDIRSATRRLGAIAGRPEQSDALLERMERAWSPDEAVALRAGRTLTLYSVRPAGAAGPRSFHVQLVDALGARSVPEQGTPYITLDGEDLRRLDPDTIILLAPGAASERTDELLAPLRSLGLRAAREQRVIIDTHPENQTPSSAMVGLAERLREALGGLPEIVSTRGAP